MQIGCLASWCQDSTTERIPVPYGKRFVVPSIPSEKRIMSRLYNGIRTPHHLARSPLAIPTETPKLHQVANLFLFNRLKPNRRPLYLKHQSVPRCKHFSSRYKNQSVYAVSGTSRCSFSDKYKTHKYSVAECILTL